MGQERRIPFFTVPNSDDPLTLAVPRNILDWSRNDRKLTLRDHVLPNTIPNPNNPSRVSRGNIVPTRSKTGDVYGCGVGSILRADGRIVNGAEENGFAGLGGYVG